MKHLKKFSYAVAFALLCGTALTACDRNNSTSGTQSTVKSTQGSTDITTGNSSFLPDESILTEIISATGQTSAESGTDESTSADNSVTENTSATETTTTETVISETVNPDDLSYTGKITLNGSSITSTGQNISVNDKTVTITAGGTYYISGTLENGQLVIDASDNKKVSVVLDNVSISNASDACINVLNTKKLNVMLADGSVNTLTCTGPIDGETVSADAALYSKEDLIFSGNGTLIINSSGNGITSKDTLTIQGGSFDITAANNGIKGKDSVEIADAVITIVSENDGIKSTNTEDTSLGFVTITSGIITITSTGDGIQAETKLLISDGTINITAGGGNKNAAKASSQVFGRFTTQTTTDDDTVSCKGIKAASDITISGGLVTIDSADDAVHSNDTVTINAGTLVLATGDDGIHADNELTINGGSINVTTCYEGLEGAAIVINDGYILLNASDDGINAAGGTDSSQSNGLFGGDNFRPGTAGNQSLTINGGYIYLSAAGDGLDSNGNIYMTGGTVIVNGPTSDGDGALDYDGTFTLTGGSLIASGSSGMLQTPGNSSTVNTVSIVFTSAQAANSVVQITDSKGNVILTYSSPKTFKSLVVSTELFETGETYTVYTNGSYSGGASVNGVYSGGTYSGTEYTTFTVSGVITSVGTAGGFGGGQMPGNFGGGGMPGNRGGR